MANILSGADFGVRFPQNGGVANNDFTNRLGSTLLGYAVQQQQQQKAAEQRLALEDKKAEIVAQVEAEENRLNGMYTNLVRIEAMPTEMAKRTALAQMGQEEFKAGRDGSMHMKALNTNNIDELNMSIKNLQQKAGSTAGQHTAMLAKYAPKSNDGKFSAISSFLEGGGTRKINPDTGDEEIRNRFNKVVTGQEAVDVLERSAKIVADKEAATQDLRVETERDLKQVKNAEATSNKAFEAIDKLRLNISNLEQVVPLIGQGANTGPISRLFPSVKAATIKLEQLQKRLALDVVGSTTFGALSAGELKLAQDVAIPTGLTGDPLIEWVNDTIDAKRKLASYLEDQAIFLSNGGTQTEWLEKKTAELEGLLIRSGATEEDIKQTMQDNGMTRSAVLEELRRRFPNGP